jgi:hypothetical protein
MKLFHFVCEKGLKGWHLESNTWPAVWDAEQALLIHSRALKAQEVGPNLEPDEV